MVFSLELSAGLEKPTTLQFAAKHLQARRKPVFQQTKYVHGSFHSMARKTKTWLADRLTCFMFVCKQNQLECVGAALNGIAIADWECIRTEGSVL